MDTFSVTLYTSQTCPYCDELRHYLHQKGQIFEERRVDQQPEAAREVVALVGDELVPVVRIQRASISPVAIVGFDKQRLDSLLGDTV